MNALGLNNLFTTFNSSSSGGLCLVWDTDIGVSILSFSINHIDAEITLDNNVWRFIGFYGFPDSKMKKHS